jgi:hypothetical protein
MNFFRFKIPFRAHFAAPWSVLAGAAAPPPAPLASALPLQNTDMLRLTTGIRSEKCVVRRFRRLANVIDCTYTNLDSIVV